MRNIINFWSTATSYQHRLTIKLSFNCGEKNTCGFILFYFIIQKYTIELEISSPSPFTLLQNFISDSSNRLPKIIESNAAIEISAVVLNLLIFS